jgi:Zn finger protein HypA/HybF involved in hydrogenase expression
MNANDLSLECKCNRCHWQGTLGQLHFALTRVPVILDNIISSGIWDESHEPCCPACQSINIVYKEQ